MLGLGASARPLVILAPIELPVGPKLGTRWICSQGDLQILPTGSAMLRHVAGSDTVRDALKARGLDEPIE